MNLINEEITHKVFGTGSVVEQNETIITVEFEDDTRRFIYPDAFKDFIQLNNKKLAEDMKEIIVEREVEEKALEKEREAQKEEQALERQHRERLRNNRIHESSQIVFWLDEEEQEKVFDEWEVFTGKVQSGKNKGQPNRAPRLRPNSAGLLTVREEEQSETDRRILGIYMVNEAFSGDVANDGMIPSHAEHRIELTEEEAEKMLFWNYYINKNYPHRTTWNTGKYRYYDNVWTAQILKDIIALKTDEEEIKKVQAFLEYFCQMNALDADNIPEPEGALKQ